MSDDLEPPWVSGCCDAPAKRAVRGSEVVYGCTACRKRCGVRLPMAKPARTELSARAEVEVTEQIGLFDNMEKRK